MADIFLYHSVLVDVTTYPILSIKAVVYHVHLAERLMAQYILLVDGLVANFHQLAVVV
jgi:hypothetical protein